MTPASKWQRRIRYRPIVAMLSTLCLGASSAWPRPAAPLQPQESSTPPAAGLMRVVAEQATLRDKPSSDGVAVSDLTKGEQLQVIERTGAWLLVRVAASGREGFVHSLLVEPVPSPALTGPPATLQLSVALVDDQLNVKPVPRHVLVLTPQSGSAAPIRLVTGFDGKLDTRVTAGAYILASDRPVDFQGRSYRWEQPLVVHASDTVVLALSVDNAVGQVRAASAPVNGAGADASLSPGAQRAAASVSQSSTASGAEMNTGLVGTWAGTYAGSPAQLRVTSQDGPHFSGTLIVTTQAGKTDSELEVSGQLLQARIEIAEASVVNRGAAKSWSLGRGTGTLSIDGQTIEGIGRDDRSEYRFHFTRRAPVTTPASVPPPGSASRESTSSPPAPPAPPAEEPARQGAGAPASKVDLDAATGPEPKERGCGPDGVKHSAETDKSRHPTPDPPSGMALIYVVRPTMLGNKIQTKLAIDGQWVGVNRGNNYFYVTTPPGEHAICSAAENSSVLVLRTEAGRTYYLQQKVSMGFMKARNKLELIDEAEGRKALAKTNLSVMSEK